MTAFGSSSCPPVPTDLDTDASAGRIIVTISENYEGPCTADLAPTTSVVELDEELDLQHPIEVIIRQADHADVTVHLDQAPGGSELTDLAREIVAAELNSRNGEDALITSATATVRRGKVLQPNAGPPCESGRLLEIKLIGSFPHIVTTGHPVEVGEDADFTVTALLLTADPETGQVCLKSVQTGEVEPLANSFQIPLG